MPVDKFGRMSDTKTKDTGVSLTYINNNYIRSDGISEITGNLNMASHTIENLGNPTKPKDAVTKEYVDYVGNVRSRIIALHARYCGPLIKDEYQFNFNGGNFKTCEEIVEKYKDFKGSTTGFLMPHSGCIKKIVVEGLYFFDFNEFMQEVNDEIVKIGLLDKEEVIIKLKEYEEKFKEELKRENKEHIIITPESVVGGVRLFKIVKFEKKLDEEDYPQLNTNPKIISSVLINDFKIKSVHFFDILKFGLMFKMLHQNDLELSEGDVISIVTSDIFYLNQLKFFNYASDLEKDRKVVNIFNKIMNNRIRNLSYNFTFLIELDPL